MASIPYTQDYIEEQKNKRPEQLLLEKGSLTLAPNRISSAPRITPQFKVNEIVNTMKANVKNTTAPPAPPAPPASGKPTDSQNLAYQQQLNRYALQKDQLRRAYELALGQYGEQEGESRASAESLGRQAYRAKMGADRTSENVSSASGLQGSGYEQLSQQKTQETYQGQYEGIMADYQNALNAIRRSRESEKLQYEQNLQNVELGIAEENQNYALLSQEAVKSLTKKASESEGYTNTRASILNLKDSTSVTNAVKKAVANNLITQEEGTKIVDEWKSINL